MVGIDLSVDTGSLATLYSVLLSGIITLLTVPIAILIAYNQIAVSLFGYRSSKSITSSPLVTFFFLIAVLSACLSVIGLTFSTVFTKGNLQLGVFEFVHTSIYAIISIVIATIALILFVAFLRGFTKTSPTKDALHSAGKDIYYSDVYQYYKNRSPWGMMEYSDYLPSGTETNTVNPRLYLEDEPMSSIVDIATSALSRHDLSSWRASLIKYTEIVLSLLKYWSIHSASVQQNDLKEQSKFAVRFTRTVTNQYRFLLETIRESGHVGQTSYLLSHANITTDYLFNAKIYCAAQNMLYLFWEGIGKYGIANEDETLISWSATVACLMAKSSLVKRDRTYLDGVDGVRGRLWSSQEFFDRSCQLLGYLGERIVSIDYQKKFNTRLTSVSSRERPLEKMCNYYFRSITHDLTDQINESHEDVKHEKYMNVIQKVSQAILDEGDKDLSYTHACIVKLNQCISDVGQYAVDTGDVLNMKFCSQSLMSCYKQISKVQIVSPILEDLKQDLLYKFIDLGRSLRVKELLLESNSVIKRREVELMWSVYDDLAGTDNDSLKNAAFTMANDAQNDFDREILNWIAHKFSA